MLEPYEIRQLPCEVVPADFARKLERERDEARKEMAKLLEWKRQAMIVDSEWEDVRKFLSRYPDINIGSSFAKSTIKFLNERDELAKDLAEERHAWEKEREDWQADYAAAQIEIQNLRKAISGRTVSCSQCNEAAKQIEDIREAINEAESILSDLCSNYPIERGYVDGPCLKREDVKEIKLTLAKLQPFLT